jgi:Kef-type K+ transport system membrane component KefB
MEHTTQNPTLPVLLVIGLTIIASFYCGKSTKYVKLPSIIGYMILGVVFGPSLLNVLNDSLQEHLAFITEIALGFVALSIGIELNLLSLKKLGKGIIYIIFAESFGAFLLVFIAVLILTRNLPLALIFGAIAPASAPAGTVAVIQEYKAKGSLTKALYAIVGFDDGLGIIIFGFAAAIARNILLRQAGETSGNIFSMIWPPVQEIVLSGVVGVLVATVFSFLARKLEHAGDVLILVVGFTFITNGLCTRFHLSLILTNMLVGMIVVNTQHHTLVQKIHDRLPLLMPLLFILFFTLAGANLHLRALPSLGVLGIVYVLARSGGLIGGSRIGALFGHVEEKIKKYVGLGILSQAGVAIGLSLIVKHEFQGLGNMLESEKTTGDMIGTTIITTVTATCIFFEIIGPILTKIALQKAGEIKIAEKK